ESSCVESLRGDEISLLAEELVQLSIKSSEVVPRQNLFLIVFETEEDLETVMEGRPWLFRKQLILFNWLVKPEIFVVLESNWMCRNLYVEEFSSQKLGMFTAPKSRYEDGMFKCHNEGDIQEEGSVMENIERLNGIDSTLEDKSKSVKKTSWKGIRPRVMMNQDKEESIMRKRKSAKIETDECSMMNSREDGYKR
ncbi:hypothetical protein Golob_006373, partial [Gossypium lobatum]|nr:hypothetical protein [Gossypium lobatum]